MNGITDFRYFKLNADFSNVKRRLAEDHSGAGSNELFVLATEEEEQVSA